MIAAREKELTSEDARAYFREKGLSYSDISEGDICVLVMMLNLNLKKACRKDEMSFSSGRMSLKVKKLFTANGQMFFCFLHMNSHYFTNRECISFNQDGFIGFAGWASVRNQAPIISAFITWCDITAKQKEILLGHLDAVSGMDPDVKPWWQEG